MPRSLLEATDDEMLRAMAMYNWPAGGGQFYTSEHEANYRRGMDEAKTILGDYQIIPDPTPPHVEYAADTPAIAQGDSWSCAPSSLRWALTAVGRNPSESWIESTMKAEGVVSEALGLLDASGAGLAAFAERHYGEYGYTASSDPSVSFDDVVAEAGRYPLLLGGRAWNHWSGVRGLTAGSDESDGPRLALANPSDGWQGVYQTMNRAQFAALGPFSLVRITHPDLAAPVPVPVDPRDARIAELEALTTSLRTQLDEARTQLGVAATVYAQTLEDVVVALRALRPAA